MVKWKADYSLTIVLVAEHVVSLKFAYKTPQNGLFVNLLITLALYWKHTEA